MVTELNINRSKPMTELPSTEHYEIVIVDDPEHPGIPIYGIRNKGTEVIEYFDNLLPRCYEAMGHTEDRYVEMLNIINNIGEGKIVQMNEKPDVEH